MALSPPKGTITDGWLVLGYEEKAEAEKDLDVVVSTDEALWVENDFAVYNGAEWKQVAVEKVVLLFTYLALNSIAKLRFNMQPFTMQEYADLPWGEQDQNQWFVHGYVNARQRVVRSRDGQSMGQYFLQTLSDEATPELLKFEMMPANGGKFTISFERT